MTMKSNLKTILTACSILVGSVIGAGFATGREIVNFFGIFGKFAPILIVVVGVGFFIGLKLFMMSANLSQNPTIKYFNDSLIFVAIFIMLSTMISGLKTINNIYFPQEFLIYIFLIISYFFIVAGMKGLSVANMVITPILILSLIAISSAFTISLPTPHEIGKTDSNTFQRCTYFLLYLGLNLFSSFPICQEIGKPLTKKQINIISLISSIALTLVVSIVYYAIMIAGENVYTSEIPLSSLAIALSPSLGFFFYIVIILAIITTLISCGFILLNYGKNLKVNKYIFTLSFMVCAYFVSKLGFSQIIKYLYPIIGVFGLLFVVMTFIQTKRPNKMLGQMINKNKTIQSK